MLAPDFLAAIGAPREFRIVIHVAGFVPFCIIESLLFYAGLGHFFCHCRLDMPILVKMHLEIFWIGRCRFGQCHLQFTPLLAVPRPPDRHWIKEFLIWTNRHTADTSSPTTCWATYSKITAPLSIDRGGPVCLDRNLTALSGALRM